MRQRARAESEAGRHEQGKLQIASAVQRIRAVAKSLQLDE